MTPNNAVLPSPKILADQRLQSLGRTLKRIALALGLIIAVWQSAIVMFELPAFVMPSPLATFQALFTHSGAITKALAHTATSTAMGLSIALILALFLAAWFTLQPTVSRALMPLVITIRTAPVLAIAPILILIFGRGQAVAVAVVVIVAFFPIMVNATKGLRAVEPSALELMHVLGAGLWQILFKLRLPTARPFIFTGLRAASAGALLSAMLAEWLSGAPGLGTLILDSASYRDLPQMWAAVAVSMAMAFAIFSITMHLEKGRQR